MKKKFAGHILILIFGLWSLLFLYQNCGAGNTKSAPLPPTAAASGGGAGNGDFYEGKPEPGTYYRFAPDVRCGVGVYVMGSVEVSPSTAVVNELDFSNCSMIQRSVSFAELEQSVYNREYLGFGPGIYMKQTPPLNLNLLNETWCRVTSLYYGIDIVVQTDLLLANPQAKRWLAARDVNGNISMAPPDTVSVARSLVNQQLTYTATDFKLTLNMGTPLMADGLRAGHVETVIDGVTVEGGAVCRTGGLLDPLVF